MCKRLCDELKLIEQINACVTPGVDWFLNCSDFLWSFAKKTLIVLVLVELLAFCVFLVLVNSGNQMDLVELAFPSPVDALLGFLALVIFNVGVWLVVMLLGGLIIILCWSIARKFSYLICLLDFSCRPSLSSAGTVLRKHKRYEPAHSQRGFIYNGVCAIPYSYQFPSVCYLSLKIDIRAMNNKFEVSSRFYNSVLAGDCVYFTCITGRLSDRTYIKSLNEVEVRVRRPRPTRPMRKPDLDIELL